MLFLLFLSKSLLPLHKDCAIKKKQWNPTQKLSLFFTALELQEEGKNAIESPTSPSAIDVGPEGYFLGTYALLFAIV